MARRCEVRVTGGMGQIDRAESFGQIAVMKVPHLLKLCLQRHDERIR